jgi:hypothetical protein
MFQPKTISTRLKNRLAQLTGRDPATDEESAVVSDGGEAPDDRPVMNTGVLVPPNSFAHAVADHLPAVEDRFGASIPCERVKDVPLHRNPLMIEDLSDIVHPRIESALIQLSERVDFVLVPASLGTGFLMYRFADVDYAFENTIDLAVASHKTAPDTLRGAAQNTILAALGNAAIEPPAIIVDHRAEAEGGVEAFPPKLAQVLGTVIHTDVANFDFGYWSLSYQTIPTGSRSSMDLSASVQRAANTMGPWCTPERWTPWSDTTESVPVLDDLNKFCVAPHGADIGRGDVNMRVINANVVNTHVCVLRPIEREWVEERVRRDALAYINDKLQQDRSRVRQVWDGHCRKYGKQNPLEEWERFRDEWIVPRLPDRATPEV